MERTSSLARLLGPRGLAVLDMIPTGPPRERATAALEAVASAVDVVRRLDLSPHELADEGSLDLAAWNALAPDVRTLLVSVRQAVDRVRQLYPDDGAPGPELASIDIDMAFEEAEFGPERGPQVDAALAEDTSPIAVLAALANMLDEDLRRFGERMRSPQLVGDRWALLGELHELKSNCGQCLDAMVAAILRPWTDQPVETWLPGYASAVTRVVRLRGRVVDLHAEALELQSILREDPGAAGLVFGRLDQLLRVFSADPAYGDLRPLDKQQLLQVRLYLMRGGPEWVEGAPRLEDFVRCLEVMQNINRREILMDHDREQLGLVVMLLESDEPVEAVRAELESVYGRHPALDEIVRGWRAQITPSADAVLAAVRDARAALGG